MSRGKHTEAPMIEVLKRPEAGRGAAEVGWQIGASKHTLCRLAGRPLHSFSVRLAVIFLAVILATHTGFAEIYKVKAGGGAGVDFTTIQACASKRNPSLQPGDTCLVFASIPSGTTYDEYVKLGAAGTRGNQITFTVNPGDHVKVLGFKMADFTTISGFEITDPSLSYPNAVLLAGTTGVQVIDNTIHEVGSSQAIRVGTYGSPSDHSVIEGNVITWPAAHPPIAVGGSCDPSLRNCGNGAAGIFINGDYNLIQDNSIAHVTDYITVYGEFNKIRNNREGATVLADFPSTTDQMHVDGVQTSCAPNLKVLPLRHLLLEGNRIEGNATPNSHFFLMQDYGCGSNGVIIRFNTAVQLGSGFLYDDRNLINVKAYNNSIIEAQTEVNPKQCAVAAFRRQSVGGAFINNLLFNSTKDGCGVYYVDESSQHGFLASTNLGYLTSGECRGKACIYTSPFDGSGIAGCKHCITDFDPKFVDPRNDFRLQKGSRAMESGSSLTSVATDDRGSGVNLQVIDAEFFQDGSNIVESDWIAVGSAENVVRIAAINYGTNTLVLANPIFRKPKDEVWLFKDSAGKVVMIGPKPFVGAFGPASSGN